MGESRLFVKDKMGKVIPARVSGVICYKNTTAGIVFNLQTEYMNSNMRLLCVCYKRKQTVTIIRDIREWKRKRQLQVSWD